MIGIGVGAVEITVQMENTSLKDKEAPQCSDCGLPAIFRTSISDPRRSVRVWIYQCTNCAKVIWSE